MNNDMTDKLKIIRIIRDTYDNRANNFFDGRDSSILTDEEKWKELIYCILAGTQVSVEIAKKAHRAILEYVDNRGHICDMRRLANKSKDDLDLLERILRKAGYRYPRLKAEYMMNAAEYFVREFGGSINLFLNSEADIKQVRNKLKKNVNGVGIKIATHWLRNIGYNLGTIDIHVRRMLEWTGLVSIDAWPKTMTDTLFISLETEIENLAKEAKVNLNVIQYELWLYGRNFCSKNKCMECMANKFCLRGRELLKNKDKLRFFSGR